MNTTFTGAETVGEIVTKFPSAANLFKASRIDFCCGGERMLTDVLQQKKLDEQQFMQRLNEEYARTVARGLDSQIQWAEVPPSELIDHIVHTHHAYLRSELPVLSEFLTKVLRVHGAAHPELAQLHRLYHQMKIELEQHLIAEEENLFPFIKKAVANPLVSSLEDALEQLDELEQDHDVVGDALKEMRTLTHDYSLPAGACRTYTLTYQKLEEMESDIFQHVHLENNVLFPHITNMKQQLQ